MVTAEANEAAEWLAELIRLESRGPGDTDNAMRRLARRYGIEYGTFWSLRYRKPRRVWADIYAAIRAARDAEIQKHIGRLQHELAVTREMVGPNDRAVRAVEALVSAQAREEDAA